MVGVEQRHGHSRQRDPLIAGVAGLPLVRVVVAAHHVQPVAERRPVALLEGRPLVGLPVERQVALHDDRGRVEGRHLGDRGTVHRLGIGGLARFGALHRADLVLAQPAGLELAEVHVVDGRETALQRTGRSWQRAHHLAEHLVVGVGCEAAETVHLQPVMGDDQVVGNGGDVHMANVLRAGVRRERPPC